MKTRSLGSLNVSALGLGCMGMTYAYGPADEAEESLIRRRRNCMFVIPTRLRQR
jgi:aryl-alcohol dehydrogenase-like predicted oxidoreductase